eukprot:4673337-Pyramimonas_sp.AAC.1
MGATICLVVGGRVLASPEGANGVAVHMIISIALVSRSGPDCAALLSARQGSRAGARRLVSHPRRALAKSKEDTCTGARGVD